MKNDMENDMKNKMISVVIPVFQEGEQICKSVHRIRKVINEIGISYELILVDDGSKDNTWDMLQQLTKEVSELRAVRLSRNFGKESALCAGLELVRGNACIIMDADLQHPPELIPQMVKFWRDGFDVVEGIKTNRGKENGINRLGAHLFYKILKKLSGLNLDSASDFKLLDEKVVNAWRHMGERTTFFRGMSAWVGFKRKALPFEVVDRASGVSKWSILRLFKLAINAITSFSSAPLQVVTFMGVLFLIGSVVLAIQTLYMKFMNIAFSGFTTVILLLLVIGSTLMISLGIIGTYIARIFDEVKFRPRYLISETIDGVDND